MSSRREITGALPEIREAEAPPAVADLYADIRAVTGVPMVNLIYRHVATVPGGLAWVWSALRPHFASGAVAATATDVLERAASNAWDEPSPLARFAANEQQAMTAIVRWYNRGNARNLVALLAFRSTTVQRAARANAAAVAPAPAPDAPLPPPLSLSELEPALRDRVAMLAERQGLAASGVTPTLYLHLARWPAALAAILDSVERAIASGAFERGVTSVAATAALAARELSRSLVAYEDPPDADGQARIAAALETFTTTAIPQMLTVGTSLVDRR